MIAFTIPGEPLAFARAGRNGKFSFTPAPQRNFMAAIRTICAAEMQGAPPLDGPIAMELQANYLWPKSVSVRKKLVAANHWKISKPDLDNIEKLVRDSINGIAYRDDAQITSGSSFKQYADVACLRVKIWSLSSEAARPQSFGTWTTVGDAATGFLAGLAKGAAE